MKQLVGKTWGRFQIIEEVGRGGVAVVYRAYDTTLERLVALKVLFPRLAAAPQFLERFRREAIVAANLRHPNIVTIYDVGIKDEVFNYIVMEFVEGHNLRQEIENRGPLSLDRVVAIINQLADALDYAHGQGLIHRDIKPANTILRAGDQVTLTDFGLVKAAKGARLTDVGATLGTLEYMSPEQVMADELDHYSDIYSLGVVVYEMLTGQVPFRGDTPTDTLHRLISQPPPSPSRLNANVSKEVERVVLRALDKEPGKRFSTARQLARSLERAIGLQSPRGRVAKARPKVAKGKGVGLKLVARDNRQFHLCEGTTTIGRATDNDVVLAKHKVSRHHAEIRCQAGSCWVVDLNSTNGTSLNGQRLSPGESRPLSPGDTLSLGPAVLEVASAQPIGDRSKTVKMD